ncbi:MAG: radical SAM protein [Actinomycetota bacterium]
MDLKELSKNLENILKSCTLCPHRCKKNRLAGETGFCRAPCMPVLSSAMPHHGEEPPISGSRGSGTMFFTYCNMQCAYCQNYQISQREEGRKKTTGQLTDIMLGLQQDGCHNINLVSPTVWVPQIISALAAAREKGLSIPLVYNTGGYDNRKIIKMLEGAVDIYMPDMRYSDDRMAYKYSGIKEYTKHNRESVTEMYRQVGGFEVSQKGIASRGLMIRLLVLPHNAAGVIDTLNFIKHKLSTEVYLSIMAQYHPVYRASDYPQINRSITPSEYRQVVEHAQKLGFERGFIQDHGFLSDDPFLPDFRKKKVFRYNEEN